MPQNPKVVEIEQRIVNLILDKLREHEITLERAREIARFILKTLPEEITDRELRQIIPKLDDTYTELVPIVLEEFRKIEETIGKAVKERVSELVKQGKIETASKLAEKYLKKDF